VTVPAATFVASQDWRRGFQLALRELLMSRLQLYTAAHAHRELEFLPAVLACAFRLSRHRAPRDGRGAIVPINPSTTSAPR
jgi:hydroxymethylglutaryl-CoA reductase (NADPH)